ncbi:CMRF35-like molecule 7 isoform X2 [Eleginops maclovinus]|uniref:CMRF35-like molecule 7 isoform X2 n=1 Tax=Eleginops maclovinus TaxID=56733 RepID=UPI0030807201
MKILLLMLSLMTGCEASSMVKGCRGGWVNFTHGYPDRNSKIQHIDLVRNNHENPPILQTNQKNVWISDGRFSVYHDTESRNIQVGIKDIQQKNFEEYELKFRREHGPNNKDKEQVDLKSDKGCQEPLIITVSRTAEANISCDKGNKKDSRVKFFCKENGPICEDVLSTKPALRSNGSFTLTETERGFTVSISDVSAQHAGVYWCGVESTGKIIYRAALRRIQLKVEVSVPPVPSTTSPPSSSIQPTTVPNHRFDWASVLEMVLALSLDVMLLMFAVYLAYKGSVLLFEAQESIQKKESKPLVSFKRSI